MHLLVKRILMSAVFYSLLKNVKLKTSAYQLLHAGYEAAV
jgi:hypothetical protein